MPFLPLGPRRGAQPSSVPRAASRPARAASPYAAQIVRPPLARVQRATGALSIGALLALPACELGTNFGDLGEQLLDPDVQGIDAPGQRWVSGPHFDLNVLRDQTGKRYAAARNEASELVLIDFEKQNFCRAGEVLRYTDAVSARSRPSLVPVIFSGAAAEGQPPELRLSFSSFDCQRSAFSVPVGGLPSRVLQGLPDGSGTALLVKTPEGGLTLIDPWAQTSTIVAESVRADDPVPAFGHYFWVDRGVITISDEELRPLAYVGHDVVAVSASLEDAQLAYLEAGSEGTSGGTLFTVDAVASEPPVLVASDACNMRYLTLNGRRQLSYLSPCAERKLVLRDVSDESVRVIDTNVAGSPAARTLSGQSVLTYVTTESQDATAGTLWVMSDNQAKVAVAENTRVGPSTVSDDGGLLTVLDWASTGGRLVEWKPDALTEVASGVIELGPLGRMANEDLTLLGNFDGVTGDLLRLRTDLTTEVLAQGVPTRSANADAFLANFEGEAGDLLLLDRSDGTSLPLASGVARGAFIFTQQFSSVLMLANHDPETRTNTLRMHLLGSQRQYVLHDRVTEAREVAFPSAGILYSVVDGDDAGVWFAKTL